MFQNAAWFNDNTEIEIDSMITLCQGKDEWPRQSPADRSVRINSCYKTCVGLMNNNHQISFKTLFGVLKGISLWHNYLRVLQPSSWNSRLTEVWTLTVGLTLGLGGILYFMIFGIDAGTGLGFYSTFYTSILIFSLLNVICHV